MQALRSLTTDPRFDGSGTATRLRDIRPPCAVPPVALPPPLSEPPLCADGLATCPLPAACGRFRARLFAPYADHGVALARKMRPAVTPMMRAVRPLRENEDQLTITASSCLSMRHDRIPTGPSKRRKAMHDHSVGSTSQRKAVSSALCLLDRKLKSMPCQLLCRTPQRLRGRRRTCRLPGSAAARHGRCDVLPG